MYQTDDAAAMWPDVARILVVDDDEDIRATLRFAFEDDGYDVVEAADGLVAWEILRAMPHSLVVLTNHQMPRLDGPGLFSFIAAHPDIAARHAYIYMTAGARVIPPNLQRHLDTLDVRTLRKPFEMDDLQAAIDEAFGKLRRRRQGARGERGA
jgi:two-component system response regulator (stage 0 sporulation protein F)